MGFSISKHFLGTKHNNNNKIFYILFHSSASKKAKLKSVLHFFEKGKFSHLINPIPELPLTVTSRGLEQIFPFQKILQLNTGIYQREQEVIFTSFLN